MKKRLISCISVLLCVCLSFTLFACSGDGNFSSVKVEGRQDTSYTVLGNGGNAVQYGNYVYFINGTRGYADDDAKQNQWGKVVKGALYRAELIGQKNPEDSKYFDIAADKDTGLEFKSKKGIDPNGDEETEIDIVNVQLIAPKTIGTSGYDGGGIFIYDDYVYYASPSNEKNKQGSVQTDYTVFLRSKLDGSKTQEIYKTDAAANSAPYAFYKRGDSVYMVVYYNNKLVSVQMKGGKVQDPVTLATDVTAAILPRRADYDSQDKSVIPEDFIYYTRNATKDDEQRSGNVIEIISPDGNEGGQYLMNGKTNTLEAVRDGIFFYRTTDTVGNTILCYDSVHDFLTNRSASYKNAPGHDQIVQVTPGTLYSNTDIANYTTTYCFRPNQNSDQVFMLGISASTVKMFSNVGTPKDVFNGAITMHFIEGNQLYFTLKDASMLYSTPLFKQSGDDMTAKTQISHTDMVSSGLKSDFVAGYAMYFAKADEFNTDGGYAFFKKVAGVEGAKEQFIGHKIDADIKPDDED